MAERCPGAKAIGHAKLPNWKFHITTRGSANILPVKGAMVHGVLWRCNHIHMHCLDDYEGVSRRNYLPRRVLVKCKIDDLHHAIAYVSERRYPGRARTDYMHSAVLPGAKAFSLPKSYISELESWLPSRRVLGTKMRYRGRRWTRISKQ